MFSLLLATFAGCSESNADETQEKSETVSEIGETETVSETEAETKPDYTAHLAGTHYDDVDFRVIGNGPECGEWESHEVDAEGLTGELINDAVYERNTYLKDTYGVNIVSVKPGADCSTAFKNAVNANSPDYEMGLINANISLQFATAGYLYDLKQLPTVQLDAIYFDGNSNSSLSVENRLYLSFGDMNLQNIDLAWCVMFNKQLAEDNSLPNMYELVENGTWDFDTFSNLARNNSRDLNGDGEITKEDSFGLVTPYDRTALAFLYGADVSFIEKDANDDPIYIPLGDKVYEMYSKIVSLYSDNASMSVSELAGAWRESESMFMANRILFYVECMQNLSRFRDMEVDFGVLPMPKYDAAQESYRHMVCDFPEATVIPAYCTDTDLAGFVLEALNAKSHDTVRDAYVEKALKYKNSRDEESLTSINIILGSMYYDPMYYYAWGALTSTIGGRAQSKRDDLASAVKAVEKRMQKSIDRTIEKYRENQ